VEGAAGLGAAGASPPGTDGTSRWAWGRLDRETWASAVARRSARTLSRAASGASRSSGIGGACGAVTLGDSVTPGDSVIVGDAAAVSDPTDAVEDGRAEGTARASAAGPTAPASRHRRPGGGECGPAAAVLVGLGVLVGQDDT
jgi:hypothetical protein